MQSPSTTSERGPRGKYSRLICQGCRSRKIKCILPTSDDLAPLGTPQPVETSCTRCRNFNLECIVERTSLGRPAAKRGPRKERPSHSPSVPPSPLTQTESRRASSELDTLIKLHLLGGVPFGNSNSGTEYDSQHLSQPEKKAIFRSMIDPLFFFSSILASNQSFGVNTPRVISRWDASLPRIISGDFANALDNL